MKPLPSLSPASSRDAPPFAPHPVWTLTALACGFVMAMLDVTIVNVALRPMQSALSMPLTGLVWVVDAYTLSFAALLLLGGAAAERLGARQMYALGLLLFTLASAACGLAQNTDQLIAARLIQGGGAALCMPASLSLLIETFPAGPVRSKMIGIWGALVSCAMAIGPGIGGVLISTMGWRAIFWVNVPVGIVGIYLVRRFTRPSPRRSQALNPIGHLFGVTCLAAGCYALIEGPAVGWLAPRIVAMTSLGILAAIGFVCWERTVHEPIFPSALRHNERFLAGTALGFLINLAAFSEIFLLSLLFEYQQPNAPMGVGLHLLPLVAAFALGNLSSALLSRQYGSAKVLLYGTLIAAAACAALLDIGTLHYSATATIIVIANLAAGAVIPAMNLTVMQAAAGSFANIAAAALNAARQIGSLIGIALMSLILQSVHSLPVAIGLGFGVLSLAFLGSAALAYSRLRDNPAA